MNVCLFVALLPCPPSSASFMRFILRRRCIHTQSTTSIDRLRHVRIQHAMYLPCVWLFPCPYSSRTRTSLPILPSRAGGDSPSKLGAENEHGSIHATVRAPTSTREQRTINLNNNSIRNSQAKHFNLIFATHDANNSKLLQHSLERSTTVGSSGSYPGGSCARKNYTDGRGSPRCYRIAH